MTFTKFEEFEPLDEFSTPPSSPPAENQESIAMSQSSTSSWFQWIKSPYSHGSSSTSIMIENNQDPFAIPLDYKWITAEEKKKKMQEKNKSKKGKGQNQNQNK